MEPPSAKKAKKEITAEVPISFLKALSTTLSGVLPQLASLPTRATRERLVLTVSTLRRQTNGYLGTETKVSALNGWPRGCLPASHFMVVRGYERSPDSKIPYILTSVIQNRSSNRIFSKMALVKMAAARRLPLHCFNGKFTQISYVASASCRSRHQFL
jgi:hypothetical protein